MISSVVYLQNMGKQLPNQNFPNLIRVRQRSDFHCGPAVVVMLASYLGIEIKQHDIVVAAQAVKSYRIRGMTVEELATGLITLHEELVFWYKNEASIADLNKLVNIHKYPVGIEWQGVFGQYADEDNGHYSVVTAINRNENNILLSDPFYFFAGRDRTFPIDEFDSRWWDINEGVKDTRTLFMVTSDNYTFPPDLNLKRFVMK
jgi:hypothetical protein